VIQALEKGGHTAEAPTMPGHNPDDDRSGIKLDSYVGKIVDVLNNQAGPAVLVGHSSAGFLLQSAAPKVANKIEQVIFLNAFVLPDGNCQFDLVPPEVAEGMTAAASASPDNCIPVIEDFVRDMLMAGEPVELQDELLSHLVPQPLALFKTKVSTADFGGLNIRKTVLFCKEDASLPPGAFLGMAKGLGEYDLIEIGGGHEALFTKPEIVANGLIQAVS
jgi:hypothetical protein